MLIGPRAKLERKFGEPIFGNTKAFQKKSYPPGEHGKSRRRISGHAQRNIEKQKVRYLYGLPAKQFQNLFKKAAKKKGNTGELLIQMLELRLDNILFRLNIARTRPAARQLIGHKKILVNNLPAKTPSITLKPGDVVSITKKARNLATIRQNLAQPPKKFAWLAWDKNHMAGKLLEIPDRKSIPERINEQRIIALFSR